MEVAVRSFGCQLNQSEGETIERELLRRNFTVVDSPGEAQVCVFNSCCITKPAAAKLRKRVRRARRENPETEIIFTGCYASLLEQSGSEEILPEVDRVVPGEEKESLPDYLEREYGAGTGSGSGQKKTCFNTRRFYKIQDGCDEFCSYCIVPHVREQIWSRPVDEVIDDLNRLGAEGYEEVALTGVHLGMYGRERNGASLGGLLSKIDAAGPDCRIRLSSIEPQDVSQNIVDLVAGSEVYCDYLYLPIQSGSDEILARMGRSYRRKDLLKLYEFCEQSAGDFAINADLMVGFPGESSDDFQKTVSLVKKLRLEGIHVFRYSERPNTPAAEMDDQVHPETVKERSKVLRDLGRRLEQEAAREQRDKRVEVVAETETENGWFGYSERHYPALVRDDCRRGQLITGDVVDVEEEKLIVRRADRSV